MGNRELPAPPPLVTDQCPRRRTGHTRTPQCVLWEASPCSGGIVRAALAGLCSGPHACSSPGAVCSPLEWPWAHRGARLVGSTPRSTVTGVRAPAANSAQAKHLGALPQAVGGTHMWARAPW